MVGAGGTFRLEPETPWHFERSESHIRAWGIFLGTGVRALKVLPILHPYQECGAGFGAAAIYPGPESEPPGHLTHTQSTTRSAYFADSRVEI